MKISPPTHTNTLSHHTFPPYQWLTTYFIYTISSELSTYHIHLTHIITLSMRSLMFWNKLFVIQEIIYFSFDEYLIDLTAILDFFSIFLASYPHTSHIILLAIYDLQTVNNPVFYNFAFLKISPPTHTNTLSHHTFPPYQWLTTYFAYTISPALSTYHIHLTHIITLSMRSLMFWNKLFVIQEIIYFSSDEYLIDLTVVLDFFSIFLASYPHTSHIILLAIYDLQTVNNPVFYNFAFLKISPLTRIIHTLA